MMKAKSARLPFTASISPLPVLLAAAALTLAGCATQPTPPQAGSAATAAPPTVSASPAARSELAALRQELAGALRGHSEVEIEELAGGALRLRVPVSDGFVSGRAEPRPALTRVLDPMLAPLAGHPRIAVKIVGHTDGVGSEMYNLQLSIARAEAVMEYLRSRGVALARLSADGKGETEPIASNADEAARRRNRRVEILLQPM